MQGIQKKFGADKFDVLMLSVDLGYGMAEAEAIRGDNHRLTDKGVTWSNVLLPKGFEDAQRLFNLDGYGLSLIGPDGRVLGIDLQPDDVERLLAEL